MSEQGKDENAMNVPSVGGARGVFEILVPGVFLILNIAGLVYVLDSKACEQLGNLFTSPALALLVVTCFGYLAGVLLRMVKSEAADLESGRWQRFAYRNKKWKQSEVDVFRARGLWWVSMGDAFSSVFEEDFPYIKWLGISAAKYLPESASEFYARVWEPRARADGSNTQFFNLCKTILESVDPRASATIYSAEALSRYISGALYALVICSLAMAGAFAYQRFVSGAHGRSWCSF
jgi:hypothetical protein